MNASRLTSAAAACLNAASANGNAEQQDRYSRPQGHISAAVDTNIDSEDTIRLLDQPTTSECPWMEILKSPTGVNRPLRIIRAIYWKLYYRGEVRGFIPNGGNLARHSE
ncbi:hypothetical protein V1282_003236 [Nitrobacteraceae bacterium AZCC 2146]